MGVPCMKGRGVGLTDSAWPHGRITYVNPVHFTSVTIFESIEAYREAMRGQQRRSQDWTVTLPQNT